MSSKTPFVATMPAPAKKAPSTTAVPSFALTEPTQDEIATRAYELFVQAGSEHGRDLEHWLRAEEELKSRK